MGRDPDGPPGYVRVVSTELFRRSASNPGRPVYSVPKRSGEPEAECERIQQILDQKGPIDICILGIGMNGHIALNEPAPSLHTNCHVAHLSQKSLQHPMIAGDTEKPGYGLTLGMANIFQSRLIILLINGIKKREITQAFLEQKISTELPASLLWLHPNVICLIDGEAAHSSN